MQNSIRFLLLLLTVIGTLNMATGCKEDDTDENIIVFEPTTPDLAVKVQEAFINVISGQTILFKAGTYSFNSTLSIDGKSGVIVKGEGRNNTILSFEGQLAGAEGLKLTGVSNFIIANLTVQDTKGDGIKVKDSNGMSFINVGAVWSGEPSASNGAYGLYPVSSTNILIDSCYVKGASDAGIYVGQTSNCIVKNSKVEYSVAGIEIENTSNADVHDNFVTHNTGGVILFDLPELPVKNGTKNRIYNNTVESNDHPNFAPTGNQVYNIPPGTGVLIMSGQEVEVFNNTLTNNNVMGVGIIAFLTLVALNPSEAYNDPDYDPYTRNVYVHDNTFSRTNDIDVAWSHPTGAVVASLFPTGNVPDILFDGFIASNDEADRICIGVNTNASFANIDVAHDFVGLSTDMSAHNCTKAPLPTPTVNAPVLP